MYQTRLSGPVIGFVLMILLLVLLFALHRPAARPQIAPRIAPPWAISQPFAPAGADQPAAPAQDPAVPLIAGGYLTVVNPEAVYGEAEQPVLTQEVEQALAYVIGRSGHSPQGPITAVIEPQADCLLNGMAYTDERRIHVYTCADIPRQRAVNVLAHEFVHQLAHDHYGDAHLHADLALSEGLATWGAGRYWLGQHADFATFVRQVYINHDEELLPLATHYHGRSINDMNKLYYEWASFVEYLLLTYDQAPFDALYVSGQGDPGSANYTGVYGKSLEQLEQEWRTWLIHS
ncbi:MAG: hypothetical protein HC837_09750 [Chloroflexaceae bacterium]|nr:hypothetical protein [Chloroflexaceae bacterium]